MSIWTILIVLLLILIYFRCQHGECTKENIVGIVTEVAGKFGSFLFDVGKYAFRRFTEIEWQD